MKTPFMIEREDIAATIGRRPPAGSAPNVSARVSCVAYAECACYRGGERISVAQAVYLKRL